MHRSASQMAMCFPQAAESRPRQSSAVSITNTALSDKRRELRAATLFLRITGVRRRAPLGGVLNFYEPAA
jgi:hypothetical protein